MIMAGLNADHAVHEEMGPDDIDFVVDRGLSSRRFAMRSYIGSLIGSLSLVFALTACAMLSKHDCVLGDADDKAEQEERYKTWFQTLTPEERAREVLRQHERALS